MGPLRKKLLRTVLHLRGQMAAVVLLVAAGVGLFVALRGMHAHLRERQASYYAEARFAHVFAPLKRAPLSLRARIERIAGVAAVEMRIVQDVALDVPGLAEPATGRIVSLPAGRRPRLNDLHLRRGRLPDAARRDEVVASDAFARANGLGPGDRIGAVLHGAWQRLTIVGTAIAPEFIYEIRGAGGVLPDNRRFGALWMPERALAAAFDLEGACNEVLVQLRPGAREAEAIARLDDLLDRFGALGAYGRDDHLSHQFISSEITETQVTSVLFPAIFLSVTALLLHTLLGRLVQMERDQVGTLKAFGLPNRTLALHYLELALLPTLLGAAAGAALGLRLASGLAAMYARFFQFPDARYDPDVDLIVIAGLVAAAAGAIGAISAVRRAVSIPPAVAMRPEAPARFRRGLLERTSIWNALSPAARVVWRNLTRQPARAILSTAGIAVSLGLILALLSLFDAMALIEDVQFRHAQREDVAVLFDDPRGPAAARELARLPGVRRVEAFRAVPVRLVHGSRVERTRVIGLEPGGALRRVVDAELRVHALSPTGLVLNRTLADDLAASPGDVLRVEVLEGSRPVRRLPVAGVVEELIGLGAYATRDGASALTGEGPTISGAWLSVDAASRADTLGRLKRRPRVAGVALREVELASFRATVAESFHISLITTTALACALVLGIVYNGARIALSERGRELASLRVLGFSKRQVAGMLLAEQAALTLGAVLPGLGVGYLLCLLIRWRFAASDLFRLPIVVTPATTLAAIGIVLAASVGSAWLVRRRVHRLDLIAALKTRE